MAAKNAEYVGFISDPLVEKMIKGQAEILNAAATPPGLAVVLANPQPDNLSYALQALQHGQALRSAVGQPLNTPPISLHVRTRAGFDIMRHPDELRAAVKDQAFPPLTTEKARNACDDDMVGRVQDLNNAPAISGILPLLPAATPKGSERVRETIRPERDPDGISPDRITVPATPQAAALLAEYILGARLNQLPDGAIGVVGYGPLVNQPLVEQVLPTHGVQPEQIGMTLRTKADIIAGLESISRSELRVLFTAVPVGALLLPRHVKPDLIVVDAGQGIDRGSGSICGNAHPDLVAMSGRDGIAVTPLRRGVGPVTTGIVYGHTLAAASRASHFDLVGATK